MIPLTRSEKTVLVFLAVAIFTGAVCLLVESRFPKVWGRFACSWEDAVFFRININTATREEWESLPSIGAYRASRIVAFREANGPFRSTEDVRYIKGIGPHVFNEIKKYLYVE